MKKLFSVAVLTLFIALVGCSKGSSGAKKALEQYIEALKKGDFQTLYELNSTTQKKVALIHRSSEADKDTSLKRNFEEYKALYDSAQPGGGTEGIWEEKFLFPADCQHTILNITVGEDKDSVTARFRDRYLARADVKVSYPNQNTAPAIGEGKVKEATYLVIFLSGEDVVRGLHKTNVTSDWIFKSIQVKEGPITYWPS